MVEYSGSSGQTLHINWNLSYDGSYHSKYYHPLLAYTRQQHAPKSRVAQSGLPADTGTKIAAVRNPQIAKMSALNTELDPSGIAVVGGNSEEGLSCESVSGVSSDTDTAYSEGSATELTEAGEGRCSDFSTPPHSDVDSTYNSDLSSVSTLEGTDERTAFQLGPDDEVEGEGEVGLEVHGEDSGTEYRKKKPDISLRLDPPPASLNMNADGTAVNGPVDEDAAEPDADSAGNKTGGTRDLDTAVSAYEYEDREFDFLKAEPVRRSTSLKTYKTPPGTPHRKKAVRFADVLGLDLESVRHILNLEEPPTVPPSAMKDLKVGLEEEHKTEGARYLTACFSQPGAAPNFFARVAEEKVVLENCLVDDKDLTITGTVRVANISYHKKVLVRYTVNNWVTFEDMCASYVQNSNDGPTDRFSFTINVPSYFGVGSKLSFAVMYSAGAGTYWDSNKGANYSVECYARALPVSNADNAWMHFL